MKTLHHHLFDHSNFLDVILDTIPANVFWQDKDGYIIGCNRAQAIALGYTVPAEVIGKHPCDLLPAQEADRLMQLITDIVTQQKEIMVAEELTFKGKLHHFITHKFPLRDATNQIIGIIGVAVDVTERKENERLQIDVTTEKRLKAELLHAKAQADKNARMLKQIIELLPGHVYWYDKDGIFYGCNDQQAKAFSLPNSDALIGKNGFELQPIASADAIKAENELIYQSGQMHTVEEQMVCSGYNGENVSLLSKKLPWRNESGEIIGVLGISFDITEEKLLREKLAEAKTRAEQAAHDIRSPLAGLTMILTSLPKDTIPERHRLGMTEAIRSIHAIATDLVDFHRVAPAVLQQEPMAHSTVTDQRQETFVSALLHQVVDNKQAEYSDLAIRVESIIEPSAYAAFICIEPIALKRALSNLINNAKDALPQQNGHIVVHMTATATQVRLTVQDNGKGMPPEIMAKIQQQIAVTYDKTDGHGYGLSQVHETLSRYQGEFSIDSTVSQGTKITLTFPRSTAPKWFAQELILGPADCIVVLDDDDTMHLGWDAHFKKISEIYPHIHLKHFKDGKEAQFFLGNLPKNCHKNTILLTDYELLKQDINGLDIITQANLARSFLVTSHYENLALQASIVKLGATMIPKQSATEIPIKVDPTLN